MRLVAIAVAGLVCSAPRRRSAQYASARPPCRSARMSADDVVRDRAGDGPRSDRSAGAQRRVLCPARRGRLRPRAARDGRCAALAGDRGRGAARSAHPTAAMRAIGVSPALCGPIAPDDDIDLAPPGSVMGSARAAASARARADARWQPPHAFSRRRRPRPNRRPSPPRRAAGAAQAPGGRARRRPPDRSSRCRRRRPRLLRAAGSRRRRQPSRPSLS